MTGAFEEDERFRATDGGHEVTTATFAATVRVVGDRVALEMRLPTLRAAVVGDDVGDAVAEGWFETLVRRLAVVGDGVTATDDVDPFDVRREEEVVVVETTLAADAPVADAVALVNFVEGTWFQGVVPGYAYTEEVEAMRQRARSRGE
jgi:hypothetical protein